MRYGMILLAALAALVPALAGACECVIRRQALGEDLPPVAEQLAQSDFVFTGTAVKIDDAFNNSTALLEVHKLWKGDARDRMRISMQTSCDTYFVQGEEYMVYATGSAKSNVLIASKCGRTQPLAQAQQDIRELGSPVAVLK